VPLLHQALKAVSDTVAAGGRVLLVGTKRQASDIGRRRRAALRPVLRQFARWLGGMLTNWKTISNSIQRLRKLDELLGGEAPGPHQEGAAEPRAASAKSSSARLSAASRTWARSRT
jgi:small subunit ribosomal protein S2